MQHGQFVFVTLKQIENLVNNKDQKVLLKQIRQVFMNSMHKHAKVKNRQTINSALQEA